VVHGLRDLAGLAKTAVFVFWYIIPEVADLLSTVHGLVQELLDFVAYRGVLYPLPYGLLRFGFLVVLLKFCARALDV